MEQNKTKKISLLTGIIIFVIGIILIVFNKSITGHSIIVIGGILFLITGIINTILFSSHRYKPNEPKNNNEPLMNIIMSWFVSIASIILGVCMLIFTDTFSKMIPVIFAILIFFGAVILALSMLVGIRKILKVPGWTWIFPCSIVITGIITLFEEASINDPLIMILTGIAMTLFGIGSFIEGILVAGANRGVKQHEQVGVKVEVKQHNANTKSTSETK